MTEELRKEAAERGAEWGRQEAQLAYDQGIAPAWENGRYCGEFPTGSREEYESILEAAAKAAYEAAEAAYEAAEEYEAADATSKAAYYAAMETYEAAMESYEAAAKAAYEAALGR